MRRTVTYAGVTVPVLGRGVIGYPVCECGERILFIQRDTRGHRFAVHGWANLAEGRSTAQRCRVTLERYAQLAEHFAEVYKRAARAARLDATRTKDRR